MDRHEEMILQQRIGSRPLDRGLRSSERVPAGVGAHPTDQLGANRERVGECGHDAEEEDCSEAEHADREKAQLIALSHLAEYEVDESGQDQTPQQDAAFEGCPGGRHGESKRCCGGVVLGQVCDREVICEQPDLQGAEGGHAAQQEQGHG